MDDYEHLLAELTSGEDGRAEAAVHSLSRFGSQVLPSLQELLASPDADLRWWVTWALAEIKDPLVPDLLAKELHDPALVVRQCAALALRQQPAAEAIPDLIFALQENDPTLAHLAAASLVAVGEKAVPALLEILEKGPQQARLEAIRALALIGDERSLQALYSALDDESALIEYWANEGLERMGVGMTFFKP
jgi:HEAT repeat protein